MFSTFCSLHLLNFSNATQINLTFLQENAKLLLCQFTMKPKGNISNVSFIEAKMGKKYIMLLEINFQLFTQMDSSKACQGTLVGRYRTSAFILLKVNFLCVCN